ncbi:MULTISPECIES: KAP family P-loop NTPase fold protein [Sphingobacterium]|uniref:KAP family P-loop NTPase fold protein n=1 Tax=Sphingobacterium TaxID=28453 RepID=UPI002580D52D|nr:MULTISPECIES: P-loop NTPase fold protein [Sphingobacterium]
MKITNEFVGKLLLLWIVFFNFLKLVVMFIWNVRENYKFRTNILSQAGYCILYSTIWIAIWFFTPISTFFKDNLLHYLFNKDLEDGSNSALVIVVSLLMILPLVLRANKFIENRYVIPFKYLSPFLAIIYLYWYYRLFTNDFYFYGVFKGETRGSLKILDLPILVLVIFIIVILFYSIFQLKAKEAKDSLMIVDSPLMDQEKDEYDRSQFYKSLIDTLATSQGTVERALSIGLVNKWGEGKTSFIGFLKKEFLKDENTIFIEFNPWYSTNSNNLTLDFFHTLDDTLSKYIYTGSLLRKYAKSLTNINSPFNPFKYLPDNWVSEKSNEKYFQDVNSLLLKLNKRIIVAIDDLDRLDNKEVFAVFQVIRNSANFSGMVFITPFDKEYVHYSLDKLNIHKPQDYLKKIFDVEISLPPINERQLTRVLDVMFKQTLDKLNKLDVESKKKIIDQFEQVLLTNRSTMVGTVKYSVIGRTIFNIFRNKRDLIRFVNSLVVSLRDSHEIVYLLDVFILELIKYLDIGLFRQLFENKAWISIKEGSNNFLKINELNLDEVGKMIMGVPDKKLHGILKELLVDLVVMPLSNDFNSDFSFHYASNYSNYHQFNYEGVSREDLNNLFND